MINQVLNDAHILAGIDNLKEKKPCFCNMDLGEQNQKPLIILCTHYIAVSDQQIWKNFLQYVKKLGCTIVDLFVDLVIDHQFYIDIFCICEMIFPATKEQDQEYLRKYFGDPINSFKDNQLNEIFYIYAKCAPFTDNQNQGKFQLVNTQLSPENVDNRSTQVAGQLFRRFYSSYANYNFKSPNPFHVIRNNTITPIDQMTVIDKLVQIMVSNDAFITYLLNHTSMFIKNDSYSQTLTTFIIQNDDLSHLIIMVYDLLNKVTDGEFHSTLILKQVSLQILDPFIHPLALSIFDFYEQLLDQEDSEERDEQKRFLPKITFLNMDGYDFEFNWKLLDQYQHSCQYISVIDEMIDGKNEESFMFDLITQDEQQFKRAKNTYIVPIRENNNHKYLNDMHFRHILDSLVYPLIKQFQPQVIIFSYSFAYFNQESDIRLSSKLFTEITTHLSLISNYKVIFLPRLLSSGIQIQDHRFEKEILKTDHKNILYYLNNFDNHVQQSYKFINSKCSNKITKYDTPFNNRYADNSMKIVKSNSFYEKQKILNKVVYQLNPEKVRYMFEILSGFLESCRSVYLQEVKDKDKRMQDPNLQCKDLLQYKIMYGQMLNKLHQIHRNHFFNAMFKPNSLQIHTYKLLSKQHSKIQKKEESQFVSFLAQDLKDYVYVIDNVDKEQPIYIQVYIRHLKSPVYIHYKLSQYFVNYQKKSIFFINVLSFKDIRELGIDSYQTCLVSYEKYLNHSEPTTQIWTEIQILKEYTEPIVFRSLCFDKQKDNLFIIYGKDAKTNSMSDTIDIYNFGKNQLSTIYRERARTLQQFARAFASSLVFSFEEQSSPKVTEIWTFGGSFLGHNQQSFCNMVEKITIEDSFFRSQKIPKETIIPSSMRPMYGALMLQIRDDTEKAILIIGGTQNELLVNIYDQQEWAYKFQQVEDSHIVTRIKIQNLDNQDQARLSPIGFFSSNHNIYSQIDKMYIINDATQILGKSYRQCSQDDFEFTEPYSPYGMLSIQTLKIIFGQPQIEQIHKKKISMRPVIMFTKNQIIDCKQVYQPFSQMHRNMKFYYKEVVNIDYHTKLLFQDNDDLVGLIKNYDCIKYIYLYINIKEDENHREGYLKPCSICFSHKNKCLFMLTCSIENGSAYFLIYSYPMDQLIHEINLSLSLNNTKLVINVYTIFAKVCMRIEHNVENIQKQLTCDNEALYLIGGHMDLKYELGQLDKILSSKYTNADNSTNQNFKISFDNPEGYQIYGEPNHFMFHQPQIIWKQYIRIFIIEKLFKFKYFSEVIEKQFTPDFKIWTTKFEYQHKDTAIWTGGILLLPSFLMKNCPIEIASQQINQKLIESIQHRKLDLFIQNHNSEFATNVKIIDHEVQDSIIVLICAVQIQNFIQILKLEFSVENKVEYLLNCRLFNNEKHKKYLQQQQQIFVPKVTLLTTTSNIEIIDGYQIFEPVNEYSNIISSIAQQNQIIVKLKEQIVVYNLQQQNM